MNNSDPSVLRTLVEAAWEKAPDEREAFLLRAIGDEQSRSKVEQLLVACEEGSGIFRTPTIFRSYLDSLWESSDFALPGTGGSAVATGSSRSSFQDDVRRFDPARSAAGPRKDLDPYGFIGQTISHYNVLSVLGAGAMGVVYKAVDTRLDRTVALKFLPPTWSQDEEARTRFFNEARAISSLHHNNVLTLLDIGEVRGLLFLSMVCCQGESLAERLEDGPLSLADTIDVAIGISRGLAAAHAKSIIHRDIKPSNVMLTDGEVKILDFGLAKIANLRMTAHDSIVGTPLYMSPEQLRGEGVDARSDIWSLGIVIYEALTGRCPFMGDYPHAVIYSILYHAPDYDAVPEEIRPLLRSMLAKDPVDRPPTAKDVERRLIEFVKPHPESRPRTKSTLAYSAAGLAVAVLVAIFALKLASTDPAVLESDEYVLVADFANNTDEDVLDHSLTEAIRVSLLQSRHVNLLSPDRVHDALERMRLSAGHPLNEQTALQVARREGASVLIAGSVDPLGSLYVLTGKLIDPTSGETVRMRRIEVEEIEQMLPAIDRLSEALRRDLGESLAMIASSAPMDRVTTSSIEALDLYGRANDLVLKGKYQEAVRLKEQAVQIDSTFAVAISDLARTYRRLGDNEKAIRYHRRIPALLDHVGDRDRFVILAGYYGPRFEMDYEAGFENAREWVARFPRDHEGHSWLGYNAMYLGRTADAIRSNQRAAELDTTYTGVMLGNSAFAQALAGNGDAALNLFRSSMRYRPDYVALRGFIAQAHWLRADYDSAEAAFRSIPTSGDALRTKKTTAHLASLYFFQGRLRDATREIAAGMTACRRTNDRENEAYFRFLAGEIDRARGDFDTARDAYLAAVELSEPPYVDLALAAASLAKMGFVSDARRALTEIEAWQGDDPQFTRRKPSMRQLMAGAIAHAEGRPADAADELAVLNELHRGDPLYLIGRKIRADALLEFDIAQAEAEYQELLNRRGDAVMANLPAVRDGGSWTSRLWPETHLELGRVYIRMERRDRAAYHLRSALKVWENADEDHVNAKEARALLDQLREV